MLERQAILVYTVVVAAIVGYKNLTCCQHAADLKVLVVGMGTGFLRFVLDYKTIRHYIYPSPCLQEFCPLLESVVSGYCKVAELVRLLVDFHVRNFDKVRFLVVYCKVPVPLALLVFLVVVKVDTVAFQTANFLRNVFGPAAAFGMVAVPMLGGDCGGLGRV